jgi:hypothetical protein
MLANELANFQLVSRFRVQLIALFLGIEEDWLPIAEDFR